MNETKQENKNSSKGFQDPYFKPVLFGGFTTAILSIIFAPAIFLWATIGGYVTSRLTYKITKEIISITDSLLLGLFSGIVGATCLNLITVISFKNPDNQRLLIKTLEKNWPVDVHPVPAFSDMLTSIFFTTCILIIAVAVVFSVLGSYIGLLLSKRNIKRDL